MFYFSIIIPVYNRPREVEELLESLTAQQYNKPFEVLVVEDGSQTTAEDIVTRFKDRLELRYFFKKNSGAGMSRNYGMKRAQGNYFIIFDSDCIIPEKYLLEVEAALEKEYTDAYGGADAAHESFSAFQKAVNFSMTSFITTGGLRGRKKSVGKFQPRSFNLGLSKAAFENTKGFSKMRIGEDIDLTFRLWQADFKTQFIEEAFVYHKRRASLKQFFKQTFAFGKGRPFLNEKYSGSAKLTYWFPSLFVLGLIVSIYGYLAGVDLGLWVYCFYGILVFFLAVAKTKSVYVALLTLLTTAVQFTGYGLGFLSGQLSLFFLRFRR